MSKLRRDRDQIIIDVTDAEGKTRTFAVAIRGGQVVFSGPRWCQADWATVQELVSALNEDLAKARRL